MFFAVIASYVVCAVFAFCGVINLVNYIGSAQKEMGYFSFIEGLAVAAWPLAAATAILLLIQIACLIEKWMLQWRISQGSAPTPHNRAEASGRQFAAPAPTAQAAQAPRPAMPPTPVAPSAAAVTYPAQFAAVTPPVLGATSAVAPAPMPTVQLTPPGAAPAHSHMGGAQQAAPQQHPAQQQQDGLSFFKLD